LFRLHELVKPNKKEPDILIIKVDKGKGFLYFLVKVSWIKNLARLPKAPPIQTYKIFNYFTSPSLLLLYKLKCFCYFGIILMADAQKEPIVEANTPKNTDRKTYTKDKSSEEEARLTVSLQKVE